MATDAQRGSLGTMQLPIADIRKLLSISLCAFCPSVNRIASDTPCSPRNILAEVAVGALHCLCGRKCSVRALGAKVLRNHHPKNAGFCGCNSDPQVADDDCTEAVSQRFWVEPSITTCKKKESYLIMMLPVFIRGVGQRDVTTVLVLRLQGLHRLPLGRRLVEIRIRPIVLLGHRWGARDHDLLLIMMARLRWLWVVTRIHRRLLIIFLMSMPTLSFSINVLELILHLNKGGLHRPVSV